MAGGNENQMRGNEYDDRTKENYQHNTNYYNYVDKASFEGYNVATTNPGTFLLLLTVMSCIACFAVMGLFVAYRKSKRDHEDEEELRQTDGKLRPIKTNWGKLSRHIGPEHRKKAYDLVNQIQELVAEISTSCPPEMIQQLPSNEAWEFNEAFAKKQH